MKNIRKMAAINAGATALYVALIGGFMYFAGSMKLGQSNFFLLPIAMLMLFVLSAAVTGFLIFGKPAQLYVDGKKKEALTLLSNTIVIFAVITVIAFVSLLVFMR